MKSTTRTKLTWSDRHTHAKTQLNRVYWKGVILATLTLFGGSLLYALYLLPVLGLHIPCLFCDILGIQDAGNGLTSAIYHLAKGNVYQSFRLNSLLYIIPPLTILAGVSGLYSFKVTSRVFTYGAGLLILSYGVLRNFEAFSFLLPTII